MFKKLNQIEEVETVLAADLIVYRLKNGELYYIDNKPIKIIDSVFSYSLKNENVFLQEENLGSLIKVNLADFHTLKVDGEFSLRGAFFIGDKYIYILGKSKGEKVVCILDINSLKVHSKIDYNCFPFLSTAIGCVCKIKSGLLYISNSLQEVIWAISFSEGERIAGEIYLHKDILVVPSMVGQMPNNKNYLQGIDVNTGKEIWKDEGYFLHLQQDTQTGLLYGFAGEKYQVIDPITGDKLVDKKFTGLKEEKRLQVYQGMSRLYGDGLYFISDHVENYYDCQFGKINTENHEIEFIKKLDVAEGVKADPPIYHKGRLYVKDSLKTLHIFEKE